MKLGMIVLGASMGLAAFGGSSAFGDTLSNWTFEVSVPTTSGPFAAELGVNAATSFASGFHSNGGVVYSNPVGNGSGESFSSNTWTIGDYYQFSTSTAGYGNIAIGWSQTRSSTGPTPFDLEWSTDGVNFNTLVNDYTVLQVSWSSQSTDPSTIFAPVTGPANLDNQGTIYFRMTSQVTPGNPAGTNRIDDVFITGDVIPAPGSAGLLGLAGLVATRRRR